jgi:hypothetical protein
MRCTKYVANACRFVCVHIAIDGDGRDEQGRDRLWNRERRCPDGRVLERLINN